MNFLDELGKTGPTTWEAGKAAVELDAALTAAITIAVRHLAACEGSVAARRWRKAAAGPATQDRQRLRSVIAKLERARGILTAIGPAVHAPGEADQAVADAELDAEPFDDSFDLGDEDNVRTHAGDAPESPQRATQHKIDRADDGEDGPC